MSTVNQIMTKNIMSVSPTTTVADAAKLMRSDRIGSLLVKKNGDFVGIVTDTDIIRRAVAEMKDLAKTAVDSIMTSPILTIESVRSIRDAQDMMGDLGVRHLTVCEGGKIVGVISARDLLVYYRSYSEPKIGQD